MLIILFKDNHAYTPKHIRLRYMTNLPVVFYGRELLLEGKNTNYKGCLKEKKKVCGLTLLLQVGTLWRCSNHLFIEVPPLASDALLTILHPLLENVLQTIDHFQISCLGAPFPWGEIWTVLRMF
jgi:hypothetical protein